MFVELIDRLRCPASHEDTWLVAAATRTIDRHLIEGSVGCPVCQAEYALVDGGVTFGPTRAAEAMSVDESEAMRAAALLAAQEGALMLFDGGWSALAEAVQGIVAVQTMVVDPPAAIHLNAGGTLRGVGERWPLANACLDGAAIEWATPARLVDLVRCLKPRGRLIAPVDAAVPAGINELARDERHWVGEKLADVVPLGRARRA